MNVTDKTELNSPDIEAYQAMKLLETGDRTSAIRRCIEAIERFGDNRNCYLVKARAHIEQEEYGFAEDSLQNVLRLDPEHPAAWAMMGEVYYRLGKETKVEYCRSRLESIFPTLAETFVAEDNDLEEDEVYGDEFDEGIDSSDAESEVEAGGKNPESEDTTEPELPEESIVPLENLEQTEEKQNTAGDGLKSELFETATFADICISQGKFEKALKIYEALLQNEPDNKTYNDKVKFIKQKWENDDSK